MARMSALLIGMESTALLVAYLAFGWPVLIVGAPVLVATALVLLVVHVDERRRAQRAAVLPVAQLPDHPPSPGLMSGFFRVPAQVGPVDVQEPAPR